MWRRWRRNYLRGRKCPQLRAAGPARGVQNANAILQLELRHGLLLHEVETSHRSMSGWSCGPLRASPKGSSSVADFPRRCERDVCSKGAEWANQACWFWRLGKECVCPWGRRVWGKIAKNRDDAMSPNWFADPKMVIMHGLTLCTYNYITLYHMILTRIIM